MQKIKWIVVHGKKLGRKLGFPTANIACSSANIQQGVFHINTIIAGKIFEWMGSYMKTKKVFEAHIFDFNENIYGKEIEVILLKKIRDNKKFSSPKELSKQIQQDQEFIKKQKLYVLTFWSFDILHEWHKYYLSEARKYGTHLITIIATDKNIEHIKKHPPLYKASKRVKSVIKLGISSEVFVWSENTPMIWLEKYLPHAICLGYDQRWKFVESLPYELNKLSLKTKIIHIGSLKPEKYKSSLLKKKK